jgi:malonyl-CoA decarboxylase
MEDRSTSLLDRLKTLRTLWRDIAGGARDAPDADLPDDDAARLRAQMRACLEGRGGEVSARARAAQLGRSYCSLGETGRRRFLSILAEDFDTDPEAVNHAIACVAAAATDRDRRAAERGLRTVLEPPRLRLLTQFNALPEGVKFLVDLRADLMAAMGEDPGLASLEADLKALLASWFDVGFLELRRLTWHTPAAVLEKIIEYEAVHAIAGWQDLKNRLDSDRRLYAFFHPRMPDEPLIFVEVALEKGMAAAIQPLLDEAAPLGDPHAADTAIFYSISNAQKGLAGISFGNFLIKRVVDLLAAELPNLRRFATLSPIPGFRAWLEQRLAEDEGFGNADRKALSRLDVPDWHLDASQADALKGPLTRLCVRYLAEAKRPRGQALDPVAHFHLSNGARIERINWLADTSAKGLRDSAGLMVNYLYRLSDIEANHEAYRGQGKVALSSRVKGVG